MALENARDIASARSALDEAARAWLDAPEGHTPALDATSPAAAPAAAPDAAAPAAPPTFAFGATPPAGAAPPPAGAVPAPKRRRRR